MKMLDSFNPEYACTNSAHTRILSLGRFAANCHFTKAIICLTRYTFNVCDS